MNHTQCELCLRLTDCLKIGMRFAAHIVADGIDLDLVTGAGMQILDDQVRSIRADGSLLVGSIALIVDLVAILLGVHIAAPTYVQALVDAAQLLDNGSSWAGIAGQTTRIGANTIGQSLHLDVVASARQQLIQVELRLRRLQLLWRRGSSIRIIVLLIVAERKARTLF